MVWHRLHFSSSRSSSWATGCTGYRYHPRQGTIASRGSSQTGQWFWRSSTSFERRQWRRSTMDTRCRTPWRQSFETRIWRRPTSRLQWPWRHPCQNLSPSSISVSTTREALGASSSPLSPKGKARAPKEKQRASPWTRDSKDWVWPGGHQMDESCASLGTQAIVMEVADASINAGWRAVMPHTRRWTTPRLNQPLDNPAVWLHPAGPHRLRVMNKGKHLKWCTFLLGVSATQTSEHSLGGEVWKISFGADGIRHWKVARSWFDWWRIVGQNFCPS